MHEVFRSTSASTSFRKRDRPHSFTGRIEPSHPAMIGDGFSWLQVVVHTLSSDAELTI
jgi:hypothetical protein